MGPTQTVHSALATLRPRVDSCLASMQFVASRPRHFHALRDDGRHCNRCSRRCNLFCSRDPETGWHGWCIVCNAEWWIHLVISSCRCCCRACSILSPVFCGLGMRGDVVKCVTSYLWVEPVLIHCLTMRRHKRALQILEWTSARLDWFLEDDSSEDSLFDEQPMLWSVRH